jgi:putative endonuclease
MLMDRANRQQRYLSGEQAEALACQYLLDQGLQLIDKNFRSRRGEIDLIMQDNGCIVFVEVRFRRSQAFGGAAASITAKKCQRLTAAAALYLQSRGYNASSPARFDALAISPGNKRLAGAAEHSESRLNDYAIDWIQNIIM